MKNFLKMLLCLAIFIPSFLACTNQIEVFPYKMLDFIILSITSLFSLAYAHAYSILSIKEINGKKD